MLFFCRPQYASSRGPHQQGPKRRRSTSRCSTLAQQDGPIKRKADPSKSETWPKVKLGGVANAGIPGAKKQRCHQSTTHTHSTTKHLPPTTTHPRTHPPHTHTKSNPPLAPKPFVPESAIARVFACMYVEYSLLNSGHLESPSLLPISTLSFLADRSVAGKSIAQPPFSS